MNPFHNFRDIRDQNFDSRVFLEENNVEYNRYQWEHEEFYTFENQVTTNRLNERKTMKIVEKIIENFFYHCTIETNFRLPNASERLSSQFDVQSTCLSSLLLNRTRSIVVTMNKIIFFVRSSLLDVVDDVVEDKDKQRINQ